MLFKTSTNTDKWLNMKQAHYLEISTGSISVMSSEMAHFALKRNKTNYACLSLHACNHMAHVFMELSSYQLLCPGVAVMQYMSIGITE
jgi:hypothetical protein